MDRGYFIDRINNAFISHSAVAILGPRQVGKTTIAREYASRYPTVHFFDLENPFDATKLEDNPFLILQTLTGLIIIDEIQTIPELFKTLRVLIDMPNCQQQYLILGSASQELLQQSSESLAGRLAYLELTPFSYLETQEIARLWQRGGFPKAYLAKTEAGSIDWRKNYVTTFLNRDLPSLGLNIPIRMMRRFWMMLVHYHGQVINYSELGASLGISDVVSKKYLDILTATFMLRQLQPWHVNIAKRQVKRPKIYFRDSGILHFLMNIPTSEILFRSNYLGRLWEGFALEEVIRKLHADEDECYFWAIHSEAELDLLIIKDGKKLGFEFKFSETPKFTKSMRTAYQVLELDALYLIFPGNDHFILAEHQQCFAAGLEYFLAH